MSRLKRFRVTIVSFAVLVGSAFLFQNCGSAFAPSRFFSVDLSMYHPDIFDGGAGLAQGKLVLGDKRHIESVIRDVFLSPESTQDELNAMNHFVHHELIVAQHLLGRPCDPIEGGDLGSCNGLLNNSQTVMDAQASSGREAARLQFCRRVISHDPLLNRAMAKVQGSSPSPTPESIDGIVRLFYPALVSPQTSEIVVRLTALDSEMATASEKLIDRWRLLFLVVCESTGWETL